MILNDHICASCICLFSNEQVCLQMGSLEASNSGLGNCIYKMHWQASFPSEIGEGAVEPL